MKEKMDPLTDQINVEILSDKCFNLFLKQVQQWYEVNGDRESLTLTGFNYKIKAETEPKSGNKFIVIVEEYNEEDLIPESESDDEDFEEIDIFENNSIKNHYESTEEQLEQFYSNKSQSSNENDLSDVTLACEDRQIKTHKIVLSSLNHAFNFNSTEQTKIIGLNSQELISEQVYNNISEAFLKEMSEAVAADVLEEIIGCSKIIYENISEEILSEMYEELNSEVFEEIYYTSCKRLCEQIFNDVFSEQCNEVIEEIIESLHNTYKTRFIESLYLCENCEENFQTVNDLKSHSEILHTQPIQSIYS